MVFGENTGYDVVFTRVTDLEYGEFDSLAFNVIAF